MEAPLNTDQDRRTFLAIVLSLGVYFVWSAWFAPLPPENPEVLAAQTTTSSISDPAVSVAPTAPTAVAPTAEPLRVVPKTVMKHSLPIAANGWSGMIDSGNGSPRSLVLTDHSKAPKLTPVWSWLIDKFFGDEEDGDGSWNPYLGGEDPQGLIGDGGSLLLAGGGEVDDDGADVSGSPSVYTVSTKDGRIEASRVRADGLQITKYYSPGPDEYSMDIEVIFENRGSSSVSKLWMGSADVMDAEAGRFDNAQRPLAHINDDLEHLLELEDLEGVEDEVYKGKVNWFGVGDRYFMAVLIPNDEIQGQVVMDTLPSGRTGSFLVDLQPLDVNAKRTYTFTAFLGPKDLDYLRTYDNQLETAVEFGWFGFFSKILLFLLKTFQSGVTNWGVSIILLTLLVKLIFFPLTQKAFVSSRRMQVLQPKLQDIREKFKDNKELQTQETMKLFRENNVNPMGGCLPTLIQLPVWFALYNVMLYSVELYDSSFLYLQDLSAEDPYGVLPTIYAAVLIIQQRMMPMANMDETQQKIMKMMPLIFAFWMFMFPSGLVLYFSVNMMLTILQQWWIKSRFKDEAAA